MKMEELTEVEEPPMTVYQIFDMAWLKCRRWIEDNAPTLIGQERADFISKAVNRPVELVIIVMSDKLARRGLDETGFAEVEERRAAITSRNHAYAHKIMRDLFQAPDLTFPPSITEKGFDYAGVFMALVDQLNSNQ